MFFLLQFKFYKISIDIENSIKIVSGCVATEFSTYHNNFAAVTAVLLWHVKL